MDSIIEVSARHIHLSADDYALLFGSEKPKEIKELSQKDIACEEAVTASGSKSTISNIRLIIPFREKSQLEISQTDAIKLGIDAPLKISGDLPGERVKIIGPRGTIEKDIAIVAKRHLHLPIKEAAEMNLSNNQIIKLKTTGERSLIFDNIIVRIKDNYSKAVHLDTDEANAAGISEETTGALII